MSLWLPFFWNCWRWKYLICRIYIVSFLYVKERMTIFQKTFRKPLAWFPLIMALWKNVNFWYSFIACWQVSQSLGEGVLSKRKKQKTYLYVTNWPDYYGFFYVLSLHYSHTPFQVDCVFFRTYDYSWIYIYIFFVVFFTDSELHLIIWVAVSHI